VELRMIHRKWYESGFFRRKNFFLMQLAVSIHQSFNDILSFLTDNVVKTPYKQLIKQDTSSSSTHSQGNVSVMQQQVGIKFQNSQKVMVYTLLTDFKFRP
jgi:hypothetical protein